MITQRIALQSITALIYCILALSCHEFYTYNHLTSLFWPAAGVGMAAVLIGGPQYAIGVGIGSLIFNILAYPHIIPIIGLTIGNVVEHY